MHWETDLFYCDIPFIEMGWNWTSVSLRYVCILPWLAQSSCFLEKEAEGNKGASRCCGHKTTEQAALTVWSPWHAGHLEPRGEEATVLPGAPGGREDDGEVQFSETDGNCGSWSKVPRFFPPVLLSRALKSQKRDKISQSNGKAEVSPQTHHLQSKARETGPWLHCESSLRENRAAWNTRGFENPDLPHIFSAKVTGRYTSVKRGKNKNKEGKDKE